MADDKSVQSIDRAIDIIEAVAVKEEGRKQRSCIIYSNHKLAI